MSERKGPPREWPAASAVGDLAAPSEYAQGWKAGVQAADASPVCSHPWWSVPASYLAIAGALALILWPIVWGTVALVDCR